MKIIVKFIFTTSQVSSYLGPFSLRVVSIKKIVFSPAGLGLEISKVTVFSMCTRTQSHIFAYTTNSRKHLVNVDIMLENDAAVAFARYVIRLRTVNCVNDTLDKRNR